MNPTATDTICFARGATAPAPTLIIDGRTLAPEPPSRHISTSFVQATVAKTPGAGPKNTLVWPHCDGVDLVVEFIQLLDGQTADTAATFCLNSLAATCAAAEDLLHVALPDRPWTVRIGNQIVTVDRLSRTSLLISLTTTTTKVHASNLELGPQRRLVTTTRSPQPYVWTSVTDVADAEQLEDDLEHLRFLAATLLGTPASASVPKLGFYSPIAAGSCLIRTRMSPGRFHPGIPVSGLTSLISAAATDAIPGLLSPSGHLTVSALNGNSLTASAAISNDEIVITLPVEVIR